MLLLPGAALTALKGAAGERYSAGTCPGGCVRIGESFRPGSFIGSVFSGKIILFAFFDGKLYNTYKKFPPVPNREYLKNKEGFKWRKR